MDGGTRGLHPLDRFHVPQTVSSRRLCLKSRICIRFFPWSRRSSLRICRSCLWSTCLTTVIPSGFQGLLPADPGLGEVSGQESAEALVLAADPVWDREKGEASAAEFTEWAGASVPR